MEDLLNGLKEIYYPEQPILKSLPKMLDKATNNQVERLEKAFEKLGN